MGKSTQRIAERDLRNKQATAADACRAAGKKKRVATVRLSAAKKNARAWRLAAINTEQNARRLAGGPDLPAWITADINADVFNTAASLADTELKVATDEETGACQALQAAQTATACFQAELALLLKYKRATQTMKRRWQETPRDALAHQSKCESERTVALLAYRARCNHAFGMEGIRPPPLAPEEVEDCCPPPAPPTTIEPPAELELPLGTPTTVPLGTPTTVPPVTPPTVPLPPSATGTPTSPGTPPLF